MQQRFLAFTIAFLLIASLTQAQQHQWVSVDSAIRSRWENEVAHADNLPKPFINSFFRAPFMFYWDSYFINEGLLLHGQTDMARNNIDNLLSVIDRYGYVGNASITPWGMNRSQPPYLSAMVRDWYQLTRSTDTAFLRRAYFTLYKEYLFWTDTSASRLEDHTTKIPGLQRFFHHASQDELLGLFREIAQRFSLDTNIAIAQKLRMADTYAAEAATGMDFTPRFEHRCPDFVAVELNSLLYVYEINFDWMVQQLHLRQQPDWRRKARSRKELLNKYCWDEARGLYLDYDFVNGRRSKVAALTAFQPLWAGLASAEQASRIVQQLGLFATPFGLVTTEKTGEIKHFQWGENSIWAPLQLIVIAGLHRYGFDREAKNWASKYLDLVTKNYLEPRPALDRKPYRLYEKYKRDGTINDDEYRANEMMGWTAGTFAWCFAFLQRH